MVTYVIFAIYRKTNYINKHVDAWCEGRVSQVPKGKVAGLVPNVILARPLIKYPT